MCYSKNIMIQKQDKIYVYGVHAVEEALLNNPGAVDLILTSESLSNEATAITRTHKIRVERLTKDSTPRGIDKTAVHQGVIARVSLANLVIPYDQFVENLQISPDTALVVMGEVQDPQNVGAIIRSAAAFGIAGVLIPEHKQAQVNGTVVKVSAGMAFRVPLVSIGNVNTTLKDLEGSAKETVTSENFEAASVIVLGNEGEGIREKTLESCDIPLSIPMNANCESLNVAASAAVALYAWSTKHPKALKKSK